MAYTRNAQYRYMSNTRLSSKAKQMIALVGAIVIGMIVSAAVNALPSAKPVNVATKINIVTPSINK
jgi:hypothetical protein